MLLRAGRSLSIVTIVAITLISPPLQAQSVDAQQVQKAIDLAIRYLIRGQRDDGGWPDVENGYDAGSTALITLALLNAGVDPQSRELSLALGYLSSRELGKTYTVSLQTMALCAANPNKYADIIKRNARWLAEAQTSAGGWTYVKESYGGATGDPSNSQFALLALHEVQRVGLAFSPEARQQIFGRAKNYWHKLQNQDGSFPYNPEDKGRGSMTCAGIASLIIVGSQLDELEADADQRVECCGNRSDDGNRIERAMQWMANYYSVLSNPGINHYHLYYLYALERAGRLTGQRFIGQHDWYRDGSQVLVRMQDPIRGAIVPRGNISQGNDLTETAFALLFLAKGKRQVVVNRLKFGIDDDWNHHGTAIQNLTGHAEQFWKRDLTWQTIDLSLTTLDALLETPVLFISGTRVPAMTDDHKRLLQEYVKQGGFIFAEACHGSGCEGKAFEDFFRKLVIELFDQPLEKIAPDHPIWFAESRVQPQDMPEGAWLYGVQTCCRLGVVYSPISLSCRWELNIPYGIPGSFAAPVKQELDTAIKVGVNVLSYATGKELKQKLDAVTVLQEADSLTPTERGVLVVPKLLHNAGANDAPRAVTNLLQWLDKENPFKISSQRRMINITPKELRNYPIVFIHGRGELKLTELEREALRGYLNDGGFIFGDAICADEQFALSFRREMQSVLGEPLVDLPTTHPMLTNNFYGFDIQTVTLMDPQGTSEQIVAAQRKVAPRLEVARVENRISVVFSPLDLSCALESRHSLQCRGYIREDAARIGINIILFALQN